MQRALVGARGEFDHEPLRQWLPGAQHRRHEGMLPHEGEGKSRSWSLQFMPRGLSCGRDEAKYGQAPDHAAVVVAPA